MPPNREIRTMMYAKKVLLTLIWSIRPRLPINKKIRLSKKNEVTSKAKLVCKRGKIIINKASKKDCKIKYKMAWLGSKFLALGNIFITK